MKDKYDILEFSLIKEKIKKYAASEKGKRLVDNICKLDDYYELNDSLKSLDEAMRIIIGYDRLPLNGVNNIDEEIELCKKGYVLDSEALYKVARNLEITMQLIKFKNGLPVLNTPLFDDLIFQLTGHDYVYKRIDSCISPTFDIYDNASSELKRVRKEIRNYEDEIKVKLKHFLDVQEDYLSDKVITYRNDRVVVPVKSSYKYQIKGHIVEDSSSGQTSFVEPDFVGDLNLKIYKLKQAEQEEIARILKMLTSLVFEHLYELEINEKIITKLDFLFAKAGYGVEIKGSVPLINKEKEIIFKHASHPLIERSKVVANDICLNKDSKLIIVSGPNAGGKTVYLKTIGLLALMGLSGLAIPVDGECKLGFLSDIFIDIGDEQSISNSLSTFSSHISKLKHILDNIDENSLVLLDEIGGGTDPKEGEALAMAIIDEIISKQSLGVITTHYSSLKSYAHDNDDIINASMLFNEEDLKPLYKIVLGVSGKSYAYEISKNLGISDAIISRAKEYQKKYSSKQDELIAKLESELTNLEIREQKLKEELENNNKLKIELEKSNKKLLDKIKEVEDRADEEVEEKIAEAIKEIDMIVEEIKSKKREDLKMNEWIEAKRKISSFEKEEEEEVIFNNDLLKVGDSVLVKTINKQGVITRINGNNYIVNVNGLALNIEKNKLEFTARKPKEKEKKVKIQVGQGISKVSYELNIIGLTVNEAMVKVVRHLDAAKLVHMKQVRIVHGFGSGALRRAVHEYLNKQKDVTYRFGGPTEGGQGATIVNFI